VRMVRPVGALYRPAYDACNQVQCGQRGWSVRRRTGRWGERTDYITDVRVVVPADVNGISSSGHHCSLRNSQQASECIRTVFVLMYSREMAEHPYTTPGYAEVAFTNPVTRSDDENAHIKALKVALPKWNVGLMVTAWVACTSVSLFGQASFLASVAPLATLNPGSGLMWRYASRAKYTVLRWPDWWIHWVFGWLCGKSDGKQKQYSY